MCLWTWSWESKPVTDKRFKKKEKGWWLVVNLRHRWEPCCVVVLLCCVGSVVVLGTLLCCCVQQKLMTKETKLETFLKFRLSVLFKVSFVWINWTGKSHTDLYQRLAFILDQISDTNLDNVKSFELGRKLISKFAFSLKVWSDQVPVSPQSNEKKKEDQLCSF